MKDVGFIIMLVTLLCASIYFESENKIWKTKTIKLQTQLIETKNQLWECQKKLHDLGVEYEIKD